MRGERKRTPSGITAGQGVRGVSPGAAAASRLDLGAVDEAGLAVRHDVLALLEPLRDDRLA